MGDTNAEKALARLPEELKAELTDEEKGRLAEIASELDAADPNSIINYGAGAQARISEFSDKVLHEVKARDTGEAGKILTDLMLNIKELDVDKLHGGSILSKLPIVGGMVDSAKRFMTRYQSVSTQVVKIVDELDRVKGQIMRDVDTLDGFYKKNLEYYRELNLYIIAGESKLDEMAETVAGLKAKADASGDQLDAQAYTDAAQAAGRLEKKLHDLRLSRMLAVQTGPQIRLVQSNNQELAQKIQVSVLNTIPLWKNQMVLAISLLRQKQAVEFQKEVSATTKQLLEKNAEMLKQGSIDIATEAEKGVIDIETLKKVNADLIATIDETIKIQRDGVIKREEAERELDRLERELKDKLVEIREGR